MLRPWDNRGISLHQMAKSAKGLSPAEVAARWGQWSLVMASDLVRADLDAYRHLESGAVVTAALEGEAAPRPAEGHDGPVQLGLWVFPLRGGGDRYSVGRVPEMDIVLHDASVSRHHCEVRIDVDGDRDRLWVRDLGSLNGTFLDGKRVDGEESAQAALRRGVELRVGHLPLIFRRSWSLVEMGLKMTPAGVAPAWS